MNDCDVFSDAGQSAAGLLASVALEAFRSVNDLTMFLQSRLRFETFSANFALESYSLVERVDVKVEAPT